MENKSKNSKNSESESESNQELQIQQVQLITNVNNMFSNMNSFMQSLKPWIDSLSNNPNYSLPTNSSNSTNSNNKRKNSHEQTPTQISDIELINLTEESTDASVSTPRTKRVKSSKEIVFVWTRISSNNQENNTSLQLQQQECEKYIKTNDLSTNQTMIFKNIGSGYSISASIKDSLKLINEYIDEKKFKVTIVCYMVDRLLRNKEKALELIEKVHTSGGNIHFVKSNVDEFSTLVSDNILHKDSITKLLDIAQGESKVKSNRIKDSIANKNDNLMISMIDNESVKKIKKFIQLFLDGGNTKYISNEFSKFVDWDAHEDWNYLKSKPITFEDDNVETRGNNQFLVKAQTEVRRDERLKNLCTLFNSFKIEVPNAFAPRKRWNFDFIKLFTKDYISNLATRINNL